MIINKFFLEIIDKSYSVLEEKLKTNRLKNKLKHSGTTGGDTPKFHLKDNLAQKMEEFQLEMFKGSEKKLIEVAKPTPQIHPGEEKEWEDSTILLVFLVILIALRITS